MLHRHFTIALLLLSVLSARAQELPANFQYENVLSGLSQPTSFRFLPDGRILVAEQRSAAVRLFIDGQLATTDPVMTVPFVLSSRNEQGLLSIAVDPLWPARPFVYAYYTYQQDTVRDTRLTRYTVSGDLDGSGDGELSIDARSPLHIITSITDDAGNHNGGDIRFGPDGMLYLSTGDDEGHRCEAQDVSSLLGKILRVRVDHLDEMRTGSVALNELVPVDDLNPFPGQGDIAALVWAYGLRNPVRFSIDAGGTIFVCDVGWNRIEEISRVEQGGTNLGWPYREGDGPGHTSISPCPEPAGFSYQSPIHEYRHADQGQGSLSIMGGVVYEPVGGLPGTFPVEYHGDVFYTEFYQSWLVRLDGFGQTFSPEEPFVADQRWAQSMSSGPGLVDFAVGPDDALYVLDLGAGELNRIRYTDPTLQSLGWLKWSFEAEN